MEMLINVNDPNITSHSIYHIVEIFALPGLTTKEPSVNKFTGYDNWNK